MVCGKKFVCESTLWIIDEFTYLVGDRWDRSILSKKLAGIDDEPELPGDFYSGTAET